MSNEKIIDLADLQAQTEELVAAIDAKDAATLGNAEDYADSCLLEAKDYADDQDASVLQDAKDYADSAASAAGSSATSASIPLAQKGAPGGVAELDANGLVPLAQLPSFVDDVLEYQDINAFPATGETGKIYVSLADNKTYRWSGSAYTEISASLALGTTDSTAGRGDWTYAGYQHALAKGSQFANNLYKITTNAEGHVVAATPVTKQDIVDLGIPGDIPVYSLPTMSPTTKGGAKQGDGLSVSDDTLNLGPLVKHSTGATDGSALYGVQGEGYATQSGTPTPSNPQEIRVARGRNLLDESSIESGGLTGTGVVDTPDRCRTRDSKRIYVKAGETYTYQGAISGSTLGCYIACYSDLTMNRVAGSGWLSTGNTYTIPDGITNIKLEFRRGDGFNFMPVDIDWAQLEQGTTPTPYVPYGYMGLEVTANGQTTVTPVPLPSKGFLGALPNGTKDTLEIDSAGHVGGVSATGEVVLNSASTVNGVSIGSGGYPNVYVSGGQESAIVKPTSSSIVLPILSDRFVKASPDSVWVSASEGYIGVGTDGTLVFSKSGLTSTSIASTWLASNPVTVLYPIATPTTWDGGYIDLPALPEGATVTCPELDNVGVDYWVSGIPEVTEYGQAMQARLQGEIDELQGEIDEVNQYGIDLAIMIGNMIRLSSINTIEFSENSSGAVNIRFKKDESNYKDVSFNSNGISYTGKSNGGLIAYWDIHA